jgi:large-conductance mechanosensitive channel
MVMNIVNQVSGEQDVESFGIGNWYSKVFVCLFGWLVGSIFYFILFYFILFYFILFPLKISLHQFPE